MIIYTTQDSDYFIISINIFSNKLQTPVLELVLLEESISVGERDLLFLQKLPSYMSD